MTRIGDVWTGIVVAASTAVEGIGPPRAAETGRGGGGADRVGRGRAGWEQSAPELLRTRVRLLIQPLQQPCCSAGVGVVVAEDPTAAGEGVLVECEGPLVLTHRG
jgi:hypothetical protein